jgi:small-conductance mechanosensitive channel
MRRIIATFEDAEDRTAAKEALRDADLKPEEPDIDNPFFDPATKMPESRGLVWGGLLGGLLGVLLLFALEQNLFWIPRISPIMTAGFYELLFLGFGLGAAVGGFLGGAIGTYRHPLDVKQPRLAVETPDHRVDETEGIFKDHDAISVDDTVTYHDHPQRTQATDSRSS